MFDNIGIKDFDAELWQAIEAESKRQEHNIELIASENYVSQRVREALSSVLTNKYAEGYPNKRYYGGCQFVDIAEELAIERVKQLFKATYANVQPHSGSQANAAVYMALLEPNDLIMSMSLSHGGHLSHGAKVNFSGKFYRVIHYGLDVATGRIDYQAARELALEHKPKLIIAGYSCYSRIVDWQAFRAIADEVGAYLMADIAHIAGLIAADLHPSPIEIADVVTSTTHKTLRGPRGGLILAGNRNAELHKKLDSVVFPGIQGGPLMHVIAAKAVAFKEALSDNFKIYQQQIVKNAKRLASGLIQQGFEIISGGTDNHSMLVSLVNKGITGKDAEAILDLANITVNKNTVPNDPKSPFITSGLRLGTPAITTRGFKEAEMDLIAKLIGSVLNNMQDQATIMAVKRQVIELCETFPVYPPIDTPVF